MQNQKYDLINLIKRWYLQIMKTRLDAFHTKNMMVIYWKRYDFYVMLCDRIISLQKRKIKAWNRNVLSDKVYSVKTMEIQKKAQRLVVILLKIEKFERSRMRKFLVVLFVSYLDSCNFASFLDVLTNDWFYVIFKTVFAKLLNQDEEDHSSKRWEMFSSRVPQRTVGEKVTRSLSRS